MIAGLIISARAAPGRAMEGLVEWDGPCGLREDGSRGGKVCGFKIQVFNGSKILLGEKFIAARPDDPQGCGHYQANVSDVLPADLPPQSIPPLITVSSTNCDGITGQPAAVYADPLCPGQVLDGSGDANQDGRQDISDAIWTLTFLFKGGPRPCANTADVNGDNRLDLSDPIYLLTYLFGGKKN
ncbi:MAG: hypothetical protein HY717_00980 [Planctomycetes bacterium]|nr:hypothetical protein [Planctomycetota bacterium]